MTSTFIAVWTLYRREPLPVDHGPHYRRLAALPTGKFADCMIPRSPTTIPQTGALALPTFSDYDGHSPAPRIFDILHPVPKTSNSVCRLGVCFLSPLRSLVPHSSRTRSATFRRATCDKRRARKRAIRYAEGGWRQEGATRRRGPPFEHGERHDIMATAS